MKLTLLGTGGPRPDPERHASSLVVEVDDRYLMFDCGRGAVMQTVRAGLPLAAIDPVFITHHHYDHISDLGDVILSTWLAGRPGTLRIHGPRGTRAIVGALIERVYAKDIRFRAEGEPAIGGWKPVEVIERDDGLVAEGERWRVLTAEVRHGQGLGIPNFDWVTLGYRLEAGGKVLAIGGDTIPCAGLDRLAAGADVLVISCYLAEREVDNDHARRLVQHLFLTSTQAGEIAERNGVRRLVLTHFRKKSPELMRALEDEVRSAFTGELVIGHDLLSISV